MEPLFSAENINYSINGIPLLQGVSISVMAGKAFLIAGRSGCGKSSLLEICARILIPDSGDIYWNGKYVNKLTYDELVSARQKIGFVFQGGALVHNLTIYDNIALPLRYHTAMSEKDIRNKVKQCMEDAGLFNVGHRFSNQLSTGQLKCAALARAMILKPAILFADEPTAGVDPFTGECIANALNHFLSGDNTGIVMTCNDISTIRRMGSNLKILDNGKMYNGNSETETAGTCRPAIFDAFRELI